MHTIRFPMFSAMVCLSAMLRDLAADDLAPANTTTSRAGATVLEKLDVIRIRGSATGGAVLDVGSDGAFDTQWTTCPTVHFDGTVYRMWFSSFYDAKMKPGGIGLATSHDGLHWKRANGGRPVLRPGEGDARDDGQVLAPEVLHDGQQYRMWYTGMSKQRHRSGIGYYRVFLAVSNDGLHWNRANAGKPVLDVGPSGAPDVVQAATPAIVREPNGYQMWYAAWSPKQSHTICVAYSRNGIVWKRKNHGHPVSGLNPTYAFGPAVTRYGSDYVMLYMGTSSAVYGAVSSDGVGWKMLNEGQPVLTTGQRGTFDDSVIGHTFLAVQGTKLRIWYTGYRRKTGGAGGWKLRIGLAEAQLPRPKVQHFLRPSSATRK